MAKKHSSDFLLEGKNNMNIELKKISICELFNGYRNSDEEGVVGYLHI